MSALEGRILPYGVFRDDLKTRAIAPAAWQWSAVGVALLEAHGREQPNLGLLALSREDGLSGCEIAPGLSLSVQSLGTSATTPRHAHAWWHIYVVQAGSGIVGWGEDGAERGLAANDIVFIPGWCVHALRNDGDATFVTLNISNMAQQADLGNFKPG